MTGKTNRLADFTGGDTGERSDDYPLADECSLCGGGYSSDVPREIADEPKERQYGEKEGRMEYRWAHVECITGEDHTEGET